MRLYCLLANVAFNLQLENDDVFYWLRKGLKIYPSNQELLDEWTLYEEFI